MSLRSISATWDHSKAQRSDLLLLLAIADEAHDDGTASPDLKSLMDKSRLSRRKVQGACRRLEALGELAIDRLPGRYGTNRYRLILPGLKTGEGRIPCPSEGRIPRPPGAHSTTSRGARNAPNYPSTDKNRDRETAGRSDAQQILSLCWPAGFTEGQRQQTLNAVETAHDMGMPYAWIAKALDGEHRGARTPWAKCDQLKDDWIRRSNRSRAQVQKQYADAVLVEAGAGKEA